MEQSSCGNGRMRKGWRCNVLMACLVLLGGCAAPRPAPVVDRLPSTKPAAPPVQAKTASQVEDTRPDIYVVRRGDTLYSIALDHGLDYRELAGWNGIDNPNMIRVGQELRIKPPQSAATARPITAVPGIEGKPVGPAERMPAAPGALVKTEPKAVRLPYSDQALAQLAEQPAAKSEAPRPLKPETAPTQSSARATDATDAAAGEDIRWNWPANGKLIATFSESANLKGISIAGKLGQPVLASAAGRVVYSGSGLRGYGKLIIIKHNREFLSVYAHNSDLLVKEGQTVVKGQKIGEMGNTDADQVNLHFEIRRFGKPIDPLKLLPSDKPA